MTPTINQKILDNGLRVVHEPMPWLSSASVTLLLPFGAVTDPEGLEGAATVLNDWQERGAGELDSRALSERFDSLGVRRGGGAGKEYTTFSASLLASAFPDALSLLADIVRRPKLPEAEFAPARTLAEQELASLADNPTQKLFETLSKRYFVSEHGRSAYGSEAGLAALSAEALRQDFKERVGPDGAILSVAGGLEWQDVLREVEAALGS